MKKEERGVRSVSFPVYFYAMCAGGWPFVAFIITFGWSQAFLLGKDFWLAHWSEQGERYPNVSNINNNQ